MKFKIRQASLGISFTYVHMNAHISIGSQL